MKSKIEKLLIAAKGANMAVGSHIDGVSITYGGSKWDPYANNDHAFQLQVDLGLYVRVDRELSKITAGTHNGIHQIELFADDISELSLKTREAIVEVACLMGFAKTVNMEGIVELAARHNVSTRAAFNIIAQWELE